MKLYHSNIKIDFKAKIFDFRAILNIKLYIFLFCQIFASSGTEKQPEPFNQERAVFF